MNIQIKSTAFLIDQLITVSNCCWHAQDEIMNESLSDEKRLAAAIKAQKMNSLRSKLMQVLDERLDQENVSVSDKTYDK